jgi:hypothetical protein
MHREAFHFIDLGSPGGYTYLSVVIALFNALWNRGDSIYLNSYD